MSMRMRFFPIVLLRAFGAFLERAIHVQDTPHRAETIPLTVQAGVPLHVVSDKAESIEFVGASVTGHLVEPVYVCDHKVIPAGSPALGRMTKVDSVSRKERASALKVPRWPEEPFSGAQVLGW
jgi:hypothetical protein